MRNQSPTKNTGSPSSFRLGSNNEDQFGQEVLSLRVDKDSFFRNDMDSPIPSSDRSSFKGLNYFPPDEGYRVSSKLERFDPPKHITMATSKGTRQTYWRYGAFTFEI